MKAEPQKDQNLDGKLAPEPVADEIRTSTAGLAAGEGADEVVEIDPAEFFDPEEFRLRRVKGRFWNDWLP